MGDRRARPRRRRARADARQSAQTAREEARDGEEQVRVRDAAAGAATRRPAQAEVRLALCQMNATVGDIAGNAERIRAGHASGAAQAGAELVLFPELALTGYPPEDLLLREHFLADAAAALAELAARRTGSSRSSASPSAPRTSTTPPPCSPTARVHAIYRKVYLPNYGVFDEQRYFQAGAAGAVIDIGEPQRHRR